MPCDKSYIEYDCMYACMHICMYVCMYFTIVNFLLFFILLYTKQFCNTHYEVARTRALRLREMRLFHLSHGGHAINPGMILP